MRASHENPLVTSRFEVISAWNSNPSPASVFNDRFSDARLLHGGMNLDLILADTTNLPNPVVPVASPHTIRLQLGPNGLLTPPSVPYEWTSSAGSYRERLILGRSLEEILIEKNEALLRVFRDGEERREDERKWLERERKLAQLQEEARRIEKQAPAESHHQPILLRHLTPLITSNGISSATLIAHLRPRILSHGGTHTWDIKLFYSLLNAFAWRNVEDGLWRPRVERERAVLEWEEWFEREVADGVQGEVDRLFDEELDCFLRGEEEEGKEMEEKKRGGGKREKRSFEDDGDEEDGEGRPRKKARLE